MATRQKTVRLSPMIPSYDLQASKRFLTEALDFQVTLDTPEYIILTRDGYDLHLCPAAGKVGQMSLYLEVEDLDQAWERFISTPGEGVPVRQPFHQEYGMKEFHVGIPKTEALLFVGQEVPIPGAESEQAP